MGALFSYLIADTLVESPERLQSLLGLMLFILICVMLSWHPRDIQWNQVSATGIGRSSNRIPLETLEGPLESRLTLSDKDASGLWSTDKRCLLSDTRMQVSWGFALQFILGFLILRTTPGQSAFTYLGEKVDGFLAYSREGSLLVFGPSSPGIFNDPVTGTQV